jgi:uncharacterized protein (DUF2267 family)
MSHLFDDKMDDAWRHERFVVTIQQRTGIACDKAERAAEATLAERIAGRDADDLAAVLPPELGSPLRRGRDRTGGKAKKMPLGEFPHSIAGREGVAPEDVLDHVLAVFKTIREFVPEKAWSNVLGQLPRDWPDALAPVPAPKHH